MHLFFYLFFLYCFLWGVLCCSVIWWLFFPSFYFIYCFVVIPRKKWIDFRFSHEFDSACRYFFFKETLLEWLIFCSIVFFFFLRVSGFILIFLFFFWESGSEMEEVGGDG